MSLSVRLTLALSAAALVLFGAVGSWQISVEAVELRRAAERDMRLLGRSLQVAFENALRDRQDQDVQETLRELERIAPEVDIFVYDAGGAQLAASTGAVERARWPAARPRHSELRFLPESDPRSVELVVPLQVTRSRVATLVVAQPLDAMRADLDATRTRVMLSVAGFVALVALLTILLARAWVGAPLARMVEQMRRVQRGDLSPINQPARRDEVGQAQHELDRLVAALRDAKTKLEEETDTRQRLEQGLREIDKLATIGQLAAGLAHEIGSPLQVLEGRVASLEAKADDPNETRRVARIVLEQAQRITRIVSRLTDLARRRPQRVQPFHVAPSVRAVVELLDAEARKRGVSLALDAEGPLPELEGDPDAIQQLTLNLVRNALQATSRGGAIKVRIEAAELVRIDRSVVPCVRLTVEDDGCGMDDETRSRAAEPFFTTRANDGGSGLGLAVVRGIVDERGGRLAMTSSVGHGTVVVADLPLATESHPKERHVAA